MTSFEATVAAIDQDDVVMEEAVVDSGDDVAMFAGDHANDDGNCNNIFAAETTRSGQHPWPMPPSPLVCARSLNASAAPVKLPSSTMTQAHPLQQHRKLSQSPPSLSLFECLPTDDMNVVLSFLTYYEFRCLAILSKRMNDAVAHTSNLHVNAMSSSSSSVSSVSFAVPNRSTSSTQDASQHRHERQSPAPVMAHGQLRTLATKQSQSKDDLRMLLNKYQSLNVLELQSGCLVGGIGDDIVTILNESPSSNTLTSLSLYGCSLSYWCTESFHLPNLQHLTLCGGSIRCTRIDLILQSSIQNLRSLSIGQCSSLRDDTIEQLVQLFRSHNHRGLNDTVVAAARSHLTLPMDHNSRSFSNKNIGNGHNRITASGMSQIRYSPISVPGGHSQQVEGESQYNPSAPQQQLQQLSLQQCIRIQSPVFDFPSLTHLSLVGCFSLRSLPKFKCPNLQLLDVSFCIRLTSDVIEQAILQSSPSSSSCPKLHSLIMVKCTGITKLSFNSQSLQHLNISYCNKLTELQMDCPSLQHLEVCRDTLRLSCGLYKHHKRRWEVAIA